MIDRVTRREALRRLALAAPVAFGAPQVLRGQDPLFVVGGRPVEISVQTVTSVAVRITIRPIEGGSDAPLADGALKAATWTGAWRGPGPAQVLSGDRVVSIRAIRDPLNIDIITPARPTSGDLVVRSFWRFAFDRESAAITFPIDGAPVLALGEGGPQFDRAGQTFPYRSGQGGYRLQTHGGRVPVQLLIAPGRGAIFVHQPVGDFDLTAATARFTPATASSPLPIDLFAIATDDPMEVMASYAAITGHAEMPPRWSFGYLQSHRTLSGPDEIRWVARTMREKKLPCDAVIYLGTDFTPSGWNTHNGEYSWNPANFPDPKATLDELHAQHFKVVLHTVVEGQTMTGTVAEPCTAPATPPGRTPDGRWPPNRQVACYWPSHKPLYDLGIDGWWPDQGDGFDGPSRLARIRMYWEGSQQWRPNERPFALHRNGYPGMARFGAFLWSGDVYSRWETLKTHVPNAVNTSLSGMPFWGTDIGGFVPTADYTGELHVRWFQFGAFCPLCRSHGRDWHLRLPWGWNTGSLGVSEISNYTNGAQDPPESELHNAEVEPICRKYLELRYRLMPYLYSAVRECAETGMPIIRAMWLHYPDDRAAIARGDQYLWGRDILVAPVVEKGATTRAVYLPRGRWFDFWTNEPLDGGREIARPVDLATMPLYVRAGAVIPMEPVRQYTAEPVAGPLTLTVYPGADGSFLIYDDDGQSFDYRRGAWMGIDIRWRDSSRELSLALASGSRMSPSGPRDVEVLVAGTSRRATTRFNGQAVSVRL